MTEVEIIQKKIAHLQAEDNKLCEEEEVITMKRVAINHEISELKEQLIVLQKELTEEAESSLRITLEKLGPIITADCVMLGSLTIVKEDVGKADYTLSVKFDLVEDGMLPYPLPSYTVVIKTMSDHVINIVREYFVQEEARYDEEKEEKDNRMYWYIDWDYHYKYKFINPNPKKH